MKKCYTCKTSKPLSDFTKLKRNKDGLEGSCKICKTAKAKTWCSNNDIKNKSYKKKWAKDNLIKTIEIGRRWRLNNPDKAKQHSRTYKTNNVDKEKINRRLRYINNPDKFKAANEKWRAGNRDKMKNLVRQWRLNNPDKINARDAKRNAAELQRTPPWLTKEHIESIRIMYAYAKKLQCKTGINYHVDHIVPLQGKNVSGLHVPWNLQVITAEENVKKGNRY